MGSWRITELHFPSHLRSHPFTKVLSLGSCQVEQTSSRLFQRKVRVQPGNSLKYFYGYIEKTVVINQEEIQIPWVYPAYFLPQPQYTMFLTHVCEYCHSCGHMWSLEDDMKMSFSIVSPPYLEIGTWNSLFWLSWLACKPLVYVPKPQPWWDRHMLPCLTFPWVLGIWSQDLILEQQALYPLSRLL